MSLNSFFLFLHCGAAVYSQLKWSRERAQMKGEKKQNETIGIKGNHKKLKTRRVFFGDLINGRVLFYTHIAGCASYTFQFSAENMKLEMSARRAKKKRRKRRERKVETIKSRGNTSFDNYLVVKTCDVCLLFLDFSSSSLFFFVFFSFLLYFIRSTSFFAGS